MTKKAMILLCGTMIAIALVFCITLITVNNPSVKPKDTSLHYIEYKKTTLEEIKALDGCTVQLTGYISLASPYDNGWIYLSSQPLSAYSSYSSDSLFGNIITCFPSLGQKLKYTEHCVTVTGTLVCAPVTDVYEYSYNYYLKDCTYETNGAKSPVIAEYEASVDSGAIAYLDELLQELNNSLTGDEEFKPFDTELMAVKWKDMTAELNPSSKLIASGEKCMELAKAVNTYKALKTPSEDCEEYKTIQSTNTELVDTMADWIKDCEVKGNETNEIQ